MLPLHQRDIALKKIYIDGWFTTIVSQPYIYFDNIYDFVDDIPNNVDVVGATFFDTNRDAQTKVIDKLLQKSSCVVINISEPTDDTQLKKFIEINNKPGLHLCGDAVLNYSAPNWETVISWFIAPENFYATKPWAKQLLTQLEPWPNRSAKYMFDCLLGVYRDHRDIIYNQYNTSQHKDKFILTYYFCRSNIEAGVWPNNVGEIDQFHNTVLRGEHETINLSWIVPVDIYNNSWYSIVAETTCYNLYSQITEKVAKPIVAERPFIAFASQHYLRNLRNLGFQTFANAIDESYDSIEDVRQRMMAAWKQVEWLCTQDPKEVYAILDSVLKHNRQHFLQTNWQSAVKKYF